MNDLNNYYIMDEKGNPKRLESFDDWAKWYETANRSIARDEFRRKSGETEEVVVSTVFLGIDHSFGFDSEPLLYETMIFGMKFDGENDYEGYQVRYSTLEEALNGHAKAITIAAKRS